MKKNRHLKLIPGIDIDEKIITGIDDCRGGQHCIVWSTIYDIRNKKVYECIRCKKLFQRMYE